MIIFCRAHLAAELCYLGIPTHYLTFCLSRLATARIMSGSLESFSRQLLNVLHTQQSQILQALNVNTYEIHQKLSAIQGDVESLRNETLSQQNAFRSAFDIVAVRLDEIQRISQPPRPAPPPIMPAPNRGSNEDPRILLDAINTRMDLAEKRLGKSMEDVTKRVQAVEQSVADISKTIKDPRASCKPDWPTS
jgi:TolA-binding protein